MLVIVHWEDIFVIYALKQERIILPVRQGKINVWN